MQLHRIVHSGDGPYCLMVHGALASRSYWNENLDALRAICRPVIVELWGHGRSPSPLDEHLYTPEGYIEQFEAIRVELGADQWFTIGQSMGAALTLAYGLAHPARILAQVVTNSASSFSDPEVWVMRNTDLVRPLAERVRVNGVGDLRDSWVNPSRSKRIAEATRSIMAAEFDEHTAEGVARSFEHTNRTTALGPDRLAAVSRPTLLTVGVDETRFLPLVERARAIPGLIVTEIEASHAVNAQNPAQWNEATVRFLTEHAPTVQG
jgi:pimeloyl-ACP methyl ester carboxylesterase